MAALALSLVLLGSAPTGAVGADPLAIVVVSLTSLTIFLIPLIALLLSFDGIVGEHERGTLMLLLSYPLARWQVVVGKVLGQTVILGGATLVGYGAAAAALSLQAEIAARGLARLFGDAGQLGHARGGLHRHGVPGQHPGARARHRGRPGGRRLAVLRPYL
jgi:ABC-type Na+ efflux pump permease subunit